MRLFGAAVVLDKSDVQLHIKRVKLSNKGRYAVQALFDIAFFNEGKPTQVKDIAQRQGIPPRFLEQIFQDLKRAGLVGSKRGPHGGYTLSRGAEGIRLGDVIRALEGPIALGEQAEASTPKAARESLRVMGQVLQDLSSQVEACFDAVTVGDICERAEKLGARRPGAQRLAYVI